MKIIQGLATLDPPLARSVLTIGNFDGVHRAHQHLLAYARSLATQARDPVVVLTFEPHPLTVVAPDRVPPRLCTPDEKLRLLGQAGADIIVVAKSDPTLLSLEAEAFVEQVVRRRFQPTHIVEGTSFGFGRGRKGTPYLLKDLAAGFGCKVHILEPITVRVDGDEPLVVSSSLIRRLLTEGRVETANRCLGRSYTLTGNVVEGDRRGQTIGFPTVNLKLADQLIPGEGVYAGRAIARAATYLAAISIGRHPTFGGGGLWVEAHLLDYHGQLYGEQVQLQFDRWLRRQQTFAGPTELADQLDRDVQAVRAGAHSTVLNDPIGRMKTS